MNEIWELKTCSKGCFLVLYFFFGDWHATFILCQFFPFVFHRSSQMTFLKNFHVWANIPFKGIKKRSEEHQSARTVISCTELFLYSFTNRAWGLKVAYSRSAVFIITAPWNKKPCLAAVSVNIAQMSNYSFGTREMPKECGRAQGYGL